MSNHIDPTVESASEQTSLATGNRIEGEVTVDLQLPPDLAYDVDDLGDGRLVIQYWHDESDSNAAEPTASPGQ